MRDNHKFQGYRWEPLNACSDDYNYQIQSFFDNIDWNALCRFASKLNNGKDCLLDPQWTIGGRHLVRIINFQDGSRWIARLRMTDRMSADEQSALEQREVDCLRLVKERTTVPVPTVFGYVTSTQNEIGAPLILMECLSGNIVPDSNCETAHGVLSQYKSSFNAEMARFQTEISSITFPKIGAIVRLEDGTYDVGPLPGLGGPFDTATEYLKAWAREARFPNLSRAKECCGEYYHDVMAQIANFPHKLQELAASIPVLDQGPFPLCHRDFGYHNIVVDDDYITLGVIDWEYACSVPWECICFPLTLMLLPALMSPPAAMDEETRSLIEERMRYIQTVQEMERTKGLPPLLSAILADEGIQDLAYAMKVYTDDGKFGFYTNILDHRRGEKKAEVSDVAGNVEGFRDGAFPPVGA